MGTGKSGRSRVLCRRVLFERERSSVDRRGHTGTSRHCMTGPGQPVVVSAPSALWYFYLTQSSSINQIKSYALVRRSVVVKQGGEGVNVFCSWP